MIFTLNSSASSRSYNSFRNSPAISDSENDGAFAILTINSPFFSWKNLSSLIFAYEGGPLLYRAFKGTSFPVFETMNSRIRPLKS